MHAAHEIQEDCAPARRIRPRIAYVTSNDPRDRRSWSGTHYYMAQALQRHCGDLVPIGPIKPGSLLLKKVLQKGLKLLTGKTYLYTHTVALSKQLANIVTKRMADQDFDLIFAPAASAHIAYLETDLPVVYLSDATFAAIVNYYPEFSGVLKSCIHEGNEIEQMAIDRASLLLYSSSWAAESARQDSTPEQAKVHVLPFGANLEAAPPAEAIMSRRPSGICKLLFVGVDWEKKGGALAFETLVELERLGVAADLTIVGCTPPKEYRHKNVSFIPFLNKNDPSQRQQLHKLYVDSDFFLLPTRADCSPIVLCEANAFGLPGIATDTGGISDIIKNGENGYLLPLHARANEYARTIAELYRNQERYLELRRNSRASFDLRLNWDSWGIAVAMLIRNLSLKHGRRQAQTARNN